MNNQVTTFDPEELRKKYLDERDKRLNALGAEQYVDIKGEFAEFADDPWVKETLKRDPIDIDTDVAVLGGGMAGILSSISLTRRGVTDFLIIEEAADLGGTWYWNRYPGIRCDIESYIYMPLLEEAGTVPTEKYSGGAEILAHFQALGRKFDLYHRALFQTRIDNAEWHEGSARWLITTNRGDTIRARFVIAGNGFLHRPKLPGIPGIDTFEGKMFHTSRWDFDYTGGSSEGGLTGLEGKRVALIGAGATGIQILPHLAESAEQVYFFQRTPAAVDARNNKATDRDWFVNQPRGWQRERMHNFQATIMGIPVESDLVNDCWTQSLSALWKSFGKGHTESADQDEDFVGLPPEDSVQLADFAHMERLRTRIDKILNDPFTAESLKPWYNLLCKRPLFSDDYLEAFNKPSVKLVDTQGRSVQRITKTGIVFDDVEYDVDAILFASGFRVGAYGAQANSYTFTGRNGATLEDRWKSGLSGSVHGTQFHDFPNLHIVGSLAHAVSSINYTLLAEEHASHSAEIVASCLQKKISVMEVTKQAEGRWMNILAESAIDRSNFESECTPGYYNNEGKPGKASFFGQLYGGGPFEYFERLKEWRTFGWIEDTRVISQEVEEGTSQVGATHKS